VNEAATGLALKVQRVDRPRPDLTALSLCGAGQRLVLLIHVGSASADFGVLGERPRGAPADDRVRQLRKRLVGSRLHSLSRIDGGLSLRLERAQETIFLLARPTAHEGERFRLFDQPPEGAALDVWPADVLLEARMLELGQAMVGALGEEESAHRQRTLDKALGRALAKLRRREKAIEGDLARIDEAPGLRSDAQLILANLGRLKRGSGEFKAMDWTLDPPRERTLALDGRLDPKDQAERLFHRARRLTRGRAVAEARLADAHRERERLEASQAELGEGMDDERQRELAAALGEALSARAGTKTREEARLPYRRYLGSGGRPVLVGRGARDNDALTLYHARPWDLWLHARDVEGAHVIVPCARGEACPSELLVDAASLAAHHSRARGQPLVDVSYVARRHVRKPKGSAPGAVRVEREKVLGLRVDPDRLARLLKTRSDR